MSDDWEHRATRRGRAELINTAAPNAARAADFLIGGRDNFEADRSAMRALLASVPAIGEIPAAARAFRERAVRYLAAEIGIRQFLDIGAGLVPSGNTHEVAQAADPASRIVYVDSDPMVISHTLAFVKSTPAGAVTCVAGDLGDVAGIIAESQRDLNFRRPVAVLLLSALAHVASAKAAAGVVSALMNAVPSGSYLAIYHLASDLDPGMADAVRQWNKLSPQPITLRSRAEIAGLVSGLDLVPPGLVPASHWSQEPDESRPGLLAPVHAVVARKPLPAAAARQARARHPSRYSARKASTCPASSSGTAATRSMTPATWRRWPMPASPLAWTCRRGPR